MSIYELVEEPIFPDPRLANDEGLLAYGGDLSVERVLLAYRSGIFPWYCEDSPDILWWSPGERTILFPDKFKLSKSLRQKIRRQTFEVRVDTAFEEVIVACGRVPRDGQDGTWITPEMMTAYIKLHHLGLAHSVESWRDGQLVGGLYGVSLGNAFFGESMFHLETDASKVAFYYLCQISKNFKFDFIDCQMKTSHLMSLGAEEVTRDEFLHMLHKSNQEKTKRGKWELIGNYEL